MSQYRVARCNLKTIYGAFDLYCFSWGSHEDNNVLCLRAKVLCEPPLVRVQSACFTGEIFRSTDCDCHEQLERSLLGIQEQGGYFIYLLRDGRGAGIYQKVRALRLYDTDHIDTADAYESLGIDKDPRDYRRVAEVLRYFRVTRIRLLTNNPRKVQGIERYGIGVERLPLLVEPTPDSYPYLKAKQEKLGHLLDIPGRS